MPPSLTGCTGQSSSLDDLQCNAWRDFYNSTGGTGWTRCSDAATDPCSCQPYGLPTCANASGYGGIASHGANANASGGGGGGGGGGRLTIAYINLPRNNLVGELLPSFGALTSLAKLWLHSNPGLGGSLPPLRSALPAQAPLGTRRTTLGRCRRRRRPSRPLGTRRRRV